MKRLLRKLDCPVAHLADDLNNPSSQAALIGWLEDRKIREYDINERSSLKAVSEGWPDAVSVYLQTLSCPVKCWERQTSSSFPPNNKRALQWLVSFAMSADFLDHQENANSQIKCADILPEDSPVSVSTDIASLSRLGEPLGLALQQQPVEAIAGISSCSCSTKLVCSQVNIFIDFLERLHSQTRIILADTERINSLLPLPNLPLGFSTKGARYFPRTCVSPCIYRRCRLHSGHNRTDSQDIAYSRFALVAIGAQRPHRNCTGPHC